MDASTPSTQPLADLIGLAREQCPYYRDAYAGLPANPALADLPIIDSTTYWEAHARDRQNILTATQRDGIVLNSSGTSGAPKYSYVTAQEWETATALSARSFDAAGMQDGDRVATLFASGNLYASSFFATDSLKKVRAKVVQFPIGYFAAFEDAAKVIEAFSINVLAGFPTHLLRLIDTLNQSGNSRVRLEHILYAGEIFAPDQQNALVSRYPGLRIQSAGYASVEGGPIGLADAGCTGSEHRVFDGSTVVEILDPETSEVIDAADRPGQIVFTNLVRRLMPLIRYPTGDLGQWVEPPGTPERKFRLLGRAGQTVRVVRYNLEFPEVQALLEPFRERFGIGQFQLVAERENQQDRLVFRVVGLASPEVLSSGGPEILEAFKQRRPDIEKAVEQGVLQPTRLDWIAPHQLITNERSGKLLAVVDRRHR